VRGSYKRKSLPSAGSSTHSNLAVFQDEALRREKGKVHPHYMVLGSWERSMRPGRDSLMSGPYRRKLCSE